MVEEEPACSQEEVREKCRNGGGHAAELLQRYNDCNNRINSKTSQTCDEELFDYFHALDKCVSRTLRTK